MQSRKSPDPAEELAPRIVLLLDGDGFAVSAKCKRAETDVESDSDKFADFRGISVHEFLHSDCAGDCGFEEMWNDARNQLQRRDFAEWELNDQILDRLLRFNLTRLPSSRDGEIERRRRNALLTIRDITKYRKAHESLRQREEELMTLVRQQGLELASAQSRLEKDGKSQKEDQMLLAEFDEKIRMLSQSVILAQENERKRIASDLHDGIAQSLMALKFSIEASIETLAANNKDIDLRSFENAADQIKGTVEEVRRISRNLAPTMLDNFGLQVAVESLCEEIESHHAGLQVECCLCVDGLCIDEKNAPNLVSIAIYRIVQEGLNNAIKHAGASLIRVVIEKLDDGIELTISDNGVGFIPEDRKVWDGDGQGLGLRSMRERVTATGGSFEIESPQDQGATIRATWSEENLALLAD